MAYEMEWQPGRFRSIHSFVDSEAEYKTSNEIKELESKIIYAQPFDYLAHGFTLHEIRMETDCPQGTMFWATAKREIICEHEFLTD